jgi:hypothetical protein
MINQKKKLWAYLWEALLIEGVHHDDFAVKNGGTAGAAEATGSRSMERRLASGLVIEQGLGPAAATDTATATGKARVYRRAGRARLGKVTRQHA